jgi:hypothetical protein
MKKIAASLLTVLLAGTSLSALAVPVRATFDGTVTGSTGFFTNVLNDVPVGTAASFDVTFDDTGIVPALPVTTLDLAPVSGFLRLGALEWILNAGQIWTYTYQTTPGNPVLAYGLQITGTGPSVGSSGGLFGLFLRLAPDFTPYGTNPLSAGFRYPTGNGEWYSYADLGGTLNVSRVTPVSEPNMALLFLGALALLWYWRRSQRITRTVEA